MLGVEVLPFVLPLLGGSTTEFAAAADAQAEAGSIPRSDTIGVQAGAEGVLSLIAGMRVISDRTAFLVTYQPQLLFEIPGTIALGRPLFFNRVLSSYGTFLDKRTGLRLNLSAGGGETSYNSLQQVFDAGSGAAEARVSTIVYGDGEVRIDHRTGRRNSVGVALEGGYRGPWKEEEQLPDGETSEDNLNTQLISKSLNVSLALSDSYDFSPRDRGTATFRGGYLTRLEDEDATSDTPAEIATDANQLVAIGGTVAWNRTLSPSSAMNYSAGIAITYALEELDAGADQLSFVPTATAGYVNGWRVGPWIWRNAVSGGVRGFLDRVSATYRPQGFADWSLNGAVGRDWTTGFSVFASTSLAPEALEPPQYESVFSVQIPTTYQLAPNATLRFGMRMLLRGPHLSGLGDNQADQLPDEPIQTQPTSQAEIVGFVGFRYVLGTGESRGAWL